MPVRPLLILLTAAILAGATAGPAGAKELSAITLCGADDCVRVGREDVRPVLTMGGPPSSGPDRAEPWYRGRALIRAPGHRETFRLAVLPRGGYLGGYDGPGPTLSWMRLNTRSQAMYRRLTRELAPIPAAKLRGVDTAAADATAPAPDPAPASNAADDEPVEEGGVGIWLLLAGALGLVVTAGLVRRGRHG